MNDSLFELPPATVVDVDTLAAAAKRMSRKRKRNFMHVALAMRTEGQGLSTIRLWGYISKHTLLRAAFHLRTEGHDHEAMVLAEHAKTVHRPLPRGKAPVKPGTVRTYHVQFGDGLDFVRVPTAPLGATRDQKSKVVVEYAEDGTHAVLRPADGTP
jgi:hypothetical protein